MGGREKKIPVKTQKKDQGGKKRRIRKEGGRNPIETSPWTADKNQQRGKMPREKGTERKLLH